MTDVDALDKHACPACGAQAEWDPGRQVLRCPFCGTGSPYQGGRATGKVVEALEATDRGAGGFGSTGGR